MAELYFLGNSSNSQMFGCVFCARGKIFVIDGGTEADGEQLCDIISQKSAGHVDGWFFTHPHHDHMGAFLHINKTHPEIHIDMIYHKFPSVDELMKYEPRTQKEMEMWTEFDSLMKGKFSNKVTCIDKGDVFAFDEIKVSVLRVYNSNITSNFVNNSSTVYRIDSPEKSVLILGDLGKEAGDEVMENCSFETLHTDYTQLAHHGQQGVKEEFYRYIKPKACLWASPDWLWNNDKGDGFDTGPWLTVQTRNWMEKLGVKEHYVQKDGTTKIVF